MFPHIILQDEKFTVNLTELIDSVAPRHPRYQEIYSVWLNSTSIVITEDNVLRITGKMGYTMGGQGNNIAQLEGDIVFRIKYKKIGSKIYIDPSKKMYANFINLYNVQRDEPDFEFLKINAPKEIENASDLALSVLVRVDSGQEVEDMAINLFIKAKKLANVSTNETIN